MIGLGTFYNTFAIILGGTLGMYCEMIITEKVQDTVMKACGLSVMFLGAWGALEMMMGLTGTVTGGVAMIAISLALGSLVGELLDLDGKLESFGLWLKVKSGSSGDDEFVDAFVTASLTVCIGAMAIVGSIQDGISGDTSTLLLKSILDFIIILVMASSLGKGCIFSALPVFLLQGTITLLATFIEPYITQAALDNLSTVGNMLIFCIGVNLVQGKTFRVVNMLPGVLLAAAWAYF